MADTSVANNREEAKLQFFSGKKSPLWEINAGQILEISESLSKFFPTHTKTPPGTILGKF